MTTTLLLIRHGQTDWNASGRWQGHQDVDLNAVGRAQAAALARRLAQRSIRAIYSSDLKRAAVTAAIVGRALGLEPLYDPAWRERNLGEFQGLTTAEVMARINGGEKRMRPGVINPPGGESELGLHARATAVYESVIARHTAETVAVVSHGGTLRAVISHVLGLQAGEFGRFSLSGNTGLSVVEVHEDGPRLTCLNDVSHLEN